MRPTFESRSQKFEALTAKAKRNAFELQESINARVDATLGITRTLLGITIVRIVLLDCALVYGTAGFKSDCAAKFGRWLVVAELDEVAVLAADRC